MVIGLMIEMKDCDLSYSTFLDIDLSGSKFANCRIHEADFSGSVLKNTVFKDCDLLRTTFYHTDLSGADFRESFNYLFDPGSNKCRGARFNSIEVLNLLRSYSIIVE